MDSTEDMSINDVNMENFPGHLIVVTHDLDGSGKHFVPGHEPCGNIYVTFNMRIAYAVYRKIETGELTVWPLPVKLTGKTSPNPNYRGSGPRFVKNLAN